MLHLPIDTNIIIYTKEILNFDHIYHCYINIFLKLHFKFHPRIRL